MNYSGSLHNHSEYSNLCLRDSINRLDELMWYAAKIGHTVFGLTEHESISSHIKAEKIYKKIKEEYPNFKLVRGNEIYLCRDDLNQDTVQKGENYYHFCLYAKNAEGHRQIRELSTRAWNRSWMNGKMRRRPTHYQDLEEVIKPNKGNVIASTACIGGFVAKKILENQQNPIENFDEKLLNWLLNIIDIFGKENFYLEMQPSNGNEQIYVNQELLKLSRKYNIPYIITTDSHYLTKEDAPIHKAFLKSQEGEREVDSFYATTYMMTTEELEKFFSYLTREELNRAYANTQSIGDRCEDYSLLKPLNIPSLIWRKPTEESKKLVEQYYKKIPWLEVFMNSSFEGDKILARLLVDKFQKQSNLNTPQIYKEVNDNLRITWQSSEVNKVHWSAYYLNLQYTIDVCWEAGTLVGPGRGSGVGFILLYMLDIIQINQAWETTKCFSWRFLNPERVSVLDIDTDIEGGRRSQVLRHLREVYGEDRVANVVTFGTEGSRSAIQTAARGLGIDVDVAIYISSLIPSDRGKQRSLSQCYYGDKENDFAPIGPFIEMMESYPELWVTAKRIENLVRGVGEHAGGVIFVDEPFTNSTALMKIPNEDTVTQYDLHDCEDVSQ